ncbi:peroxiredoxin [Ideonella livida]|uniref:thioredoxin-dependent peroxiredoxin n=1 Tax=Ideonella livida TaxID=2707176 RepID=A0A7C9TGU2_9BURK|nr:peroxiredoxin [Ideonella livida]NDY90021.1 peroxiredoxin [Ideonella livida]
MRPAAALPCPSPARRRALAGLGAGLVATCGLWSPGARAALAPGAKAPDFTLEAALGGQPFRFSLAEALKGGPVVVYFYPKAFTSGCTVEAHLFAEATPQFKALGATVIGVSNDDIATLKRFSTEACRNQFAVAADAGGKVIRQYDAGFTLAPGMADRISYVVSPQGQVLLAYSSLDPDGHVKATMEAVKAWRARNPR